MHRQLTTETHDPSSDPSRLSPEGPKAGSPPSPESPPSPGSGDGVTGFQCGTNAFMFSHPLTQCQPSDWRAKGPTPTSRKFQADATDQHWQAERYVLLVSTKVSPPSLTRICTSGTTPTAFSACGSDQGSKSAISIDGDRIRYSDTAWQSDSSTGTSIGVLSFAHMLVHPRAKRTRVTPAHAATVPQVYNACSHSEGRCCARTTKFTAFQDGQPFADTQTFGPQ